MKEVNICRNTVKFYRNEKNSAFLDILEQEIPEVDLEGQTIYDNEFFALKIKEGVKVDEELIASRRYLLKHKLFLYRRKMTRWTVLYRQIYNNVE